MTSENNLVNSFIERNINMNYGFISLFIPVIVIALAVFTKRIISSLIVGILAGGIMLASGNIIQGVILATEHLVKSIATEESVYIILFLFVFGAFGEIMKVSGGIKGFTEITNKFVKTERGALGAVWIVSTVTFIDCCFHGIAAGTVVKPLIEKTNGNKMRFAFVLNVTSCLLIILIPFGTTYVGYIVGVIASSLSKAGIHKSAYELFIKSIPYNFYAITMLLISIVVIIFNLGFNKTNDSNTKGEEANTNGHGEDEAHEQCEFEEKVSPRPLNLILPLTLLIVTTFFFFWFTGKDKGIGFTGAIMNADFEKSIFMSALTTLVITSVFYVIQKIPMNEIESHFLSGGNEMMPPIIVLTLSWALSSIVQDLGFTKFVTSVMGNGVPHFLIPASIFLLGCVISYFMGSAWGTWALIMPIAIPIAVATNINLALIIGSVLAGGSLGDNASPLGETAILSSTISEVPLMEHIKSELPFCLIGVGISTILFIIFSIV